MFPSLSRLVCLTIFSVSIFVYLPVLTSVKWLPVCWDCKGSNDFDIVKNLFFFLFFAVSSIHLPFPVNTKKDNLLLLFSLSNYFFFILLTVSLPPKRSANVEENLGSAKQYVEISCLHPLRC